MGKKIGFGVIGRCLSFWVPVYASFTRLVDSLSFGEFGDLVVCEDTTFFLTAIPGFKSLSLIFIRYVDASVEEYEIDEESRCKCQLLICASISKVHA